MWDWDLRDDSLFLSPRFKEFLGLPDEDGNRPEHWLDLVHPDDLDWLYASFEGQMMGAPLPFQIEHRVRRPDAPSDSATDTASTDGHSTSAAGSDSDSRVWRWLLCRGIVVQNEDNVAIRLVGSVTDITERKLAEQALRQSEERYALAAAASNDGLYDWDLENSTVYYSPRWKALLRLNDAEVGNKPDDWLSRILPEDRKTFHSTITGLDADNTSFQIEYRMTDGMGEIRWMSCRGIVVLSGLAPVRVVGSQADVTARKEAEQGLLQSEERYALAAAAANDGLWDWKFDSGEVYYSPRWKAMLGLGDREVPPCIASWFDLVARDDLEGLRTAIAMHVTSKRNYLEHEFRMTAANGELVWMQVRGLAVRNEEGRSTRLVGSMTDITARKRAEHQLLFDAFHDGLTGLPNRTLLLDRVGQALDRNRGATAQHFAILNIDLDRFKSINDAMGNTVGDEILKVIAQRLDAYRRVGDTVARLSADEFAMLLDNVDDAATTLTVAEELSRAITRPVNIEGQDIVLTASIGIALSITKYERAEDMLRDASLAMYRAKSGGRARIDVFDVLLRRQAMTTMRVESDLRAAIEHDQLRLYYQPIINLQTGRIAGFEALMRWLHPDRGLVSPAEFIPLAEESGLIVPMGNWAMCQAVGQLARWQKSFPGDEELFMSVNVSSRQFDGDDLIKRVRQCLDRSGITPSTLKLELTESLLMQDPTKARTAMEAIRAMDVRLSIDDFGTGYSSLSYLHQFPVDTLKIDRSFVQALSSGQGNSAIVQVINTLANILGMDAIAEGIENEVEASFLREIRCKYGQGFLFAKPAPADVIEGLLCREWKELTVTPPAQTQPCC